MNKEIKNRDRALIIANGNIENPHAFAGFLKENYSYSQRDYIICADGGAANALDMGFIPDAVIGDMDSIKIETREKIKINNKEAAFIETPREKDESDTQLAVEFAIGRGVKEITIIGATGDRIDHTLANIILLASKKLKKIDARILSENNEIFVINSSRVIRGGIGKLISIFSLTPYTLFKSTEGLKYPLKSEKLFSSPVRGLSNVFTEETAKIEIEKGQLLIIKQI